MFELCGALSKSEVPAKESIPTQARTLLSRRGNSIQTMYAG